MTWTLAVTIRSLRSWCLAATTLCCLAVTTLSCEQRGEREAPGRASGGTAKQPNVIIILADDLGYGDLSSYLPGGAGSVEPIDTPNIDRLAAEGVRLTNYYAAAPVCTPSRAALLTGCYPPRVGLSTLDTGDSVIKRPSRVGLNPDEATIAELLQRAGYATACIGKWHLGLADEFYPTRHGFEFHYGPIEGTAAAGTPMLRNGEVADRVRDEDITRRLTEEAVGFIRNNRDRPFFLYLAHMVPHGPLAATEDFRGRSRRGRYGDVVMSLDWYTGVLLDELEAMNIATNTLVVFTSDNGPARGFDRAGIRFEGSAAPFRGHKASATEGAYRVPCLVRYPARIPAGSTSDGMVAAMDLLPTLSGLAQAGLPDRQIDGVDVWNVLIGERPSPRTTFFYYHKGSLTAIRDGVWKMRLPRRRGPAALHDLDADREERLDVSAEHPDTIRRMGELADTVRRDLGDVRAGENGTGCRPPGVADATS